MARYKGDKRRKPESLREQIHERPGDIYNRQREDDVISQQRRKIFPEMAKREFEIQQEDQDNELLKSKRKKLRNQNLLDMEEDNAKKRKADLQRAEELEKLQRPHEDAMLKAEQNTQLLNVLTKQFKAFKEAQEAMDALGIDPDDKLSPDFIKAQIPDEFKSGN